MKSLTLQWSCFKGKGQHTKEVYGGVEYTTNNRMELMACIKGLEALKSACNVTIISDSAYLVDCINKGWAKKWQAKGWMRNGRERAQNVDLWERLLELIALHEVSFSWVRGHSGHPMNERCDYLAQRAARGEYLEKDFGYSC